VKERRAAKRIREVILQYGVNSYRGRHHGNLFLCVCGEQNGRTERKEKIMARKKADSQINELFDHVHVRRAPGQPCHFCFYDPANAVAFAQILLKAARKAEKHDATVVVWCHKKQGQMKSHLQITSAWDE